MPRPARHVLYRRELVSLSLLLTFSSCSETGRLNEAGSRQVAGSGGRGVFLLRFLIRFQNHVTTQLHQLFLRAASCSPFFYKRGCFCPNKPAPFRKAADWSLLPLHTPFPAFLCTGQCDLLTSVCRCIHACVRTHTHFLLASVLCSMMLNGSSLPRRRLQTGACSQHVKTYLSQLFKIRRLHRRH